MFIIIIFLSGLMHGYVFLRMASLPWVSSHARLRGMWLAALVLWVLFILGAVYGYDGSGRLASWLERFALDWLGVMFIATMVVLSIDLMTGFGLWGRRYLQPLRSGAFLVAGALIAVALVQGWRAPVLAQYEVTLSGLPKALDGTTMVVLSDLHLGSQLGADWLAARIEQVQALEPDMILLLGDIFEGSRKPKPELLHLFNRLKAPLGVYAVTGNHDYLGDVGAVVARTEKQGVVWLRDRLALIRPGLRLAGVDDLSTRMRRGEALDVVTRVMQPHRQQGATILLSHASLQANDAATAGVGLMLSGHNHGGQIWPFGYVVRRFYPLFVGRYEVEGMTVLVSRGTGLWGPRMRLWQPGEILKVTLTAP